MTPRTPHFLKVTALCLMLGWGTANAGLFDDEEARRAILELRQKIESLRQEADQKVSEVNRRAAEDNAQLKRSLLDLQNQLEMSKSEAAGLRGSYEQLARDLAEYQRRQKDTLAALEERLRKFEPVRVTVDGQEFMAEPAEKRDYEASLAIFRKGDFANATIGFVDFLNRNPQTGYRAAALFWLGNAQYATKDYKSAQVNFRNLVTQSPDHVRAPEALLAIANCQLESKDPKAARKTLEELLASYPNSDAAGAAKDRLSKIK